MVKEGHAERLTDLIYAETPEMRKLLGKVGQTLGTLQDLGLEVQKRFPDEVAAMRQQAEEAAKKGEASSFLQKMSGQALAGGRRQRRGAPDPTEANEMRSGFDMLMKQIF